MARIHMALGIRVTSQVLMVIRQTIILGVACRQIVLSRSLIHHLNTMHLPQLPADTVSLPPHSSWRHQTHGDQENETSMATYNIHLLAVAVAEDAAVAEAAGEEGVAAEVEEVEEEERTITCIHHTSITITPRIKSTAHQNGHSITRWELTAITCILIHRILGAYCGARAGLWVVQATAPRQVNTPPPLPSSLSTSSPLNNSIQTVAAQTGNHEPSLFETPRGSSSAKTAAQTCVP